MILSTNSLGGKSQQFSQRRSRGKNVANFDPRKVGFKIIFELREENLQDQVGSSLQHYGSQSRPVTALFQPRA
jgi:hypothetical protein